MSDLSTLLIIEDHAVLRAGLEAMIRDSAPEIQITASLASGDEAVKFCRRTPPQVILLDLSLPGLCGLGLIEAIAAVAPHSRIIVLSMYCDEASVLGALQAGARGYVRKTNSGETVLEAIRAVLSGASYLDPEASRMVFDRMRSGETLERVKSNLSPRETDILRLLALGHASREIATQLGLTVQAVRTHRTAIRRKLGVSNTAGATRVAIEMGLTKGRALAATAS